MPNKEWEMPIARHRNCYCKKYANLVGFSQDALAGVKMAKNMPRFVRHRAGGALTNPPTIFFNFSEFLKNRIFRKGL